MPMSRVTVYLQNATKRKIEALASATGKSQSTFIARLLESFLANSDRFPLEEIANILEYNSYESIDSAWWYRELTENAPVLIWASGLDKGCKFFNKAWMDFTGKPLESLLGDGWADDVHPEDIEFCLKTYCKAFDARECFDIEYRLRRHNGEYRWLIDTAAPHYNDNGTFLGYIGSCLDITPRKTLESKLNLAATSIDLLDDGVMITGPDRSISWVNLAFTKITGYTLDDVHGKKPDILSSGKHDPEFYAHMYYKLVAGERWQGEIWNRRKSGEIYPEWLSINIVKDDTGRIVNYVGVFSDITKQKAKEELSRYLSTHDPLTGLANRYLLEQTLDFAILNVKRSKKGIAVLFIDLDGFKWINDTYGHLIGDDLLKDVASAITSSIRESDLATRPGGDEFIVVLENLACIDDAMEVAKKISHPIYLKIDPSAFVTFSIGISYYEGGDEAGANTLIEQADAAMYRAKQSGKNSIRIAAEPI